MSQRLKLLNYLSTHSPDIIFVTETWLYPKILDSEIFPLECNYSIISRSDRLTGEHGGVLIATKNSLQYNHLKVSNLNDFSAAIYLTDNYSSHMFLLIYNPSKNSPYRVRSDLLIDCISSYYNDDLLLSNSFTILGDINLDDACWATSTAHSDYSKIILDKFESLNLLPIVFEPTYRSGSTLDIILTTNPELFTVFVDDKLYSDHFAVFAWFKLPMPLTSQSCQSTSKFSASSFSAQCFNQNLSTNYYDLLSLPNTSLNQVSADDYVSFWYQVLTNAINASCQRKTNRRQEFPYFYSSHSIHMINKLRTAEKNNYNPEFKKKLVDDIQNSIELDKTILIESLSPNSTRSCFKYLRSFSLNHLPNQMHWKHVKASTSIDIANLFNSYFSSVYQSSTEISIPSVVNPQICLQEMTIDISVVHELLSKVSSNSSSDPIPAFVYNFCPEILAPLVTQLFNTIIQTKQWPHLWKCSIIKPILKSGNPENMENYRPISNLPQLSLILEKILFSFIYSNIRPLICDQQHGFLKKRSTITQLLPYLDKLYSEMDVNNPSYAVYFDFSKAFDLVPHHILLQKLASFNFDIEFLNLFESYLNQRSQKVYINGCLSDSAKITSGVPQGSVLGPLLFIIFINDLPSVVSSSSSHLFADDSKLHSVLTVSDMQHDIDGFQNWEVENLMKFNVPKCKSMSFNITESIDPFILDGNELQVVNVIKDLGIFISDNLSWDEHIQSKLLAARKSFHFLKRNIPQNVSILTKLLYYRLCVQCILLYGSQLWYPSLIYRRKLELFNKKCLKWVTGLSDYREQLTTTHTLPISFYLVYYDMLFLNKTIHGKYDLNIHDFICFSHPARDLRSSKYIHLSPVKPCRKFKTQETYFQRICRYSNYLPSKNISVFDNLERFKSDLNTFLHSRVSSFDLNRSCSWFIKCSCSICRS